MKKQTTPGPRLTQIPSAPRLPIAMDTSQLNRGQVEAMKRMRQVDPNSLAVKDLLGVSGSPTIDRILD